MPVSSQERTRKAREAFDAKFPDPEAKSRHFSELAQRQRGKVVLSASDARALGSVAVDPNAMSPTQRAAWDRLWRVLLDRDPGAASSDVAATP